MGFAAMLPQLIAAGAQVGGSAIAASGASSMNLANREWSAQQAQINRSFQQQMLSQTENYNTMMSDTAVTRRAQDLKMAGLNPMLAIGNPASAPMASAPSGSMANTPVTQNPGQFMGQGVAASAQSAANIANTMADTDQKAAQAKISAAQVPYAGQQAAANVQSTLQATQTARASMYDLQSHFDLNVQNTAGLMQNQEFQRELFPLQQELQRLDIQRQRLGMPALQADAEFWSGISPQAKQILIGAKEAMTPFQQGSSAIANLARIPMVD